MPRVRLWYVGPECLTAPLRSQGVEVVDLRAHFPTVAGRAGIPFDIRELWPTAAQRPDALLVVDTLAAPALPYGIEDIPVPRLYYALDVHLNYHWQHHYAQLFDHVFVVQKDYVPLFADRGLPAAWLPWGADAPFLATSDRPRKYDLAFVGAVDRASRPKRAALVELLRRSFGMAVFGVDAAQRLSADETARVLSQTKIAFNEAILGDVNYRVFEAMACGALLLTEAVGNGLGDIFRTGEHLITYTPETLVPLVQHYLGAELERARIAASGRALVHAEHTLTVRMQQLTSTLRRGVCRRDVASRAPLHWGKTAHLLVLRGLADPRVAWPAALESLRRSVLDEKDAEAAVATAEALAATGAHTSALRALATARALDPSNLPACLMAAELEWRAGHHEQASTLVLAGVRAAPAVSSHTRTRVAAGLVQGLTSAPCRFALGLALQEAGYPFTPGFVAALDPGTPRTAVEYYTAALNSDPHHIEAALAAAGVLRFVGLPEHALPFYDLAAALGGERSTGERNCCRREAYMALDRSASPGEYA